MSSSRLRERVAAIVAELPEATCGDGHNLAFTVREKTFGYFLDDHHGNGWAEVRERLTDACRLQAPKRLVARLDG
jgi:hypothetical protein